MPSHPSARPPERFHSRIRHLLPFPVRWAAGLVPSAANRSTFRSSSGRKRFVVHHSCRGTPPGRRCKAAARSPTSLRRVTRMGTIRGPTATALFQPSPRRTPSRGALGRASRGRRWVLAGHPGAPPAQTRRDAPPTAGSGLRTLTIPIAAHRKPLCFVNRPPTHPHQSGISRGIKHHRSRKPRAIEGNGRKSLKIGLNSGISVLGLQIHHVFRTFHGP